MVIALSGLDNSLFEINMSLQHEIQEYASRIYRDAYQMSIGELINLYKDGELDIHPEFQRIFRWSSRQKTKLIESIVLNIPIPQIFVNQREDGVWDVIDGVQRLSTILQFVGEYKNKEDKKEEALVLEKTDYLPSLEGVRWQCDDETKCFSSEQKINFKRSRIDVVIVKQNSDTNSKYELFQRLNTGGSALSAQEIRNCMMIMANHDFYELVMKMEKNEHFRSCTQISDRKSDEQYRMELVLKLMIADVFDWDSIGLYSDLTEMLDKETLRMCDSKFDYEDINDKFERTFIVLNRFNGENVFKKRKNNIPCGGFLSSAYQAIATGVYHNIDSIYNMPEEDRNQWLENKVETMFSSSQYSDCMSQGAKPITRFKNLSLLGMTHFC